LSAVCTKLVQGLINDFLSLIIERWNFEFRLSEGLRKQAHMEAENFLKLREHQGMASRRVSEGSSYLILRVLIRKNSSRYNKGKYFMK
jgi:hypothetical protein